MLSGYDHFSEHPEKITADIEHWKKCVYRNFDAVLRIIIATKNIDSNRCVICANLSICWKTKSTLANHYRYSHKTQIVGYYLEHFIKLTPDELHVLMKIEGDDTIGQV